MKKLEMSMIIEELEGTRERSFQAQSEFMMDGICETLRDAGLDDDWNTCELWTMVMDEDYGAVEEYINELNK